MNILFDIGATKTRIALTNSSNSFETPVVYSTPADYDEGIKNLKDKISEISKDEQIEYIVGGIAGKWSDNNGVVIESGNLSGWDNKPLKKDLSDAFNTKVLVDNDAAMAGLGESVYGAGRGYSKILYITVSTGVGGAVIIDNKVTDRLEPRKEVVNESGETLGRLISGRAIENRTGKKPEDIVDPIFWDGLSKTLARGLDLLTVRWSPDVIVLGGSIVESNSISVPVVEKYLKDLVKTSPQLRNAELGDFGGLYGGLVFMNQNLLSTES